MIGLKTCRSDTTTIDQEPLLTIDFQKIMRVLEILSLIALAIFAAYCDPKLFFPFFGAGMIAGIYMKWKANKEYHDNHEHEHEHGHGAGCSGYLEQTTKVRMPVPISLAMNAAMLGCHIEHHSPVFVPIMGLYVGWGLGEALFTAGSFCHRKFCQVCAPRIVSVHG